MFPDHPEWGLTYWNLALVPMFDDDGEVEAFLFSLNEVTELQRAEEALRRSEIQLREAQRIANMGSWEWTLKSGEFLMSAEICNILGEAPEARQTNLEYFLNFTPEPHRNTLRMALDAALLGQPFEIEHEILRKDNVTRIVSERGQVFWSPQGLPERMVGTTHDITDRKQVELLKDEFISTVSHELRTPLTSIVGSLGLILGEQMGEVSKEQRELLTMAAANGERLTGLINELLDIQKIESGKLGLRFEKVSLTDLLEETVSLNRGYAEKLSIKLELQPFPNQTTILADKSRLIQVLSNLISNAIKFSPKNEKVSIGFFTNANTVRVQVIDQGPGVAEEFKPNIFKKFSQANTGNTRDVEGTGLGLSISKAIIEDHGGKLDFITKDGEGSTFFFDLPAHG